MYGYPLVPPRTELFYYGGRNKNYSVMANCESPHISSGIGRATGWRVGAKTRLLATTMRALYPLGLSSMVVMT